MKDSFDYFDKHPDSAKKRGMTQEEYEEYRMEVIMRNGNNGEHYDEMYAEHMKLRRMDKDLRNEFWDDGEYDDIE